MARTIRKMQVPAYWPVVLGIQEYEYSGVCREVKYAMTMSLMSMMVPSDMSMPDIAVEEAEAIDDMVIEDMVIVAMPNEAAVDISKPDMPLMVPRSGLPVLSGSRRGKINCNRIQHKSPVYGRM